MPVFGRRRKSSLDETEEALDAVSPSARSAVMGSKRARNLWRSLVEKVGLPTAIEHLEVAYLMGMIDGALGAVSAVMKDWHAGSVSDAYTLQGLAAARDDFEPRVKVAIANVTQASTRPESLAIAVAGHNYVASHFNIANSYIMGSMTEEKGHAAMAAKQGWTDSCDHWDAATNRSRLPLVGG